MLMMMRADDSYTPATAGCSAEELLACITADDYDACIAACSDENQEEENLPGYAKISGKAEASQSVALNAVDKKIGTVTLKAGENDTTVTNIEITKAGLGARTDIDKIQLMKNGEYVTSNGTLNSNNVAKLRFKPNLVLKANSSETFDVVVSMAGSGTAQAGGTHEFSVTAVTVANGTFDGAPVKLGSLTTTNYVVSEATISLPSSAITLKAGDENKEITRVNVSTPVDATLKSITLTVANNINENLYDVLSNVKAYVDDKAIGSVSVNEESIVISNLDTVVEKNEDVDVVLKGTDVFVGSGFSITLEADTGHVVVFENNTNERMNSTYDTSTLNIQGVDLKITNNVTTAQTVSINEKNVVLLDMTVSSSNEMEVTNFYVTFPLTGAAFTGNFKDEEVTLYVDGIDYTINATKLGNTGKVEFTKDDSFTVSANHPVKVQVKGTFSSNTAINGIEFGMTEVKNVNEKTAFAISTIKKTGHKTTPKGGNVTISKATTPSANTIEMGAEQDVLFFKVKAPSEDVKLTGFTLVITGTDSNNVLSGRSSTPITNVAIYAEGESSAIVDFDIDEMSDWTSGTNTLAKTVTTDEFNYVVSAGETVNFVVKATFDNAEVTDLGDTYKVALTAVNGQGVTSKGAISLSNAVEGTAYTVVTEKPDVELVKNGKFINVTVKNNSSYDVVFNSGAAAAETGVITIDIESVASSNDNYLLDLSADNAPTVEVLDGENGNSIGTATYATGVITVNFDNQFVVESSSEEEFTLKLVSTNQILDTYYNVSKKSADFNYYDADAATPTTSKYINVKY